MDRFVALTQRERRTGRFDRIVRVRGIYLKGDGLKVAGFSLGDTLDRALLGTFLADRE